MATLTDDIPFSTNFSGLAQLQANGQGWDPASYPNGVPGRIDIDDGWFKATIAQTDVLTFTGIRAEVILSPDALNDEVWYTWEMMIKSSEWSDNTGVMVLGQMHPEDSIVSAVNWGFIAENGELYLVVPQEEPPTELEREHKIKIGELKLDHVYSFAVHANWKNDSTGLMEIFVDGKQIWKKWSRGTAYNLDAPYIKLGIYDGPHQANFGTKSARFRNLKRYTGTAGYDTFLGEPPRPPQALIDHKHY